MTPITVELTAEQSQRLQEIAESLHVEPQQLVLDAVKGLLGELPNDFNDAAAYILSKNKELYERLS